MEFYVQGSVYIISEYLSHYYQIWVMKNAK